MKDETITKNLANLNSRHCTIAAQIYVERALSDELWLKRKDYLGAMGFVETYHDVQMKWFMSFFYFLGFLQKD